MNISTRKFAIASCLAVFMSGSTLAIASEPKGNQAGHDMMSMMSAEGVSENIPVKGTINKVDMEKRSVNVTHEPVPALKWPSMTMDLPVTKRVDLATVKPGTAVVFTLKQGRDKNFRIISIKPGK